MGLPELVSATAAANGDALPAVERVKIQEDAAQPSRRKCEFHQMREVAFVCKAGDFALSTSYLPQSSSASRRTASHAGFFILSQSGERPER